MSDLNKKASYYYVHGKMCFKKKDFNQALAHFLKAHELDITNLKYLHNLGNVYIKTRQMEKAISCYEKGLELVSEKNDVITFWKRLAKAWIGYGDTEKGIDYYEKILNSRIDQYGELH
jgi:tetratricopeptide (TPR) repeat protein